jgi:TonB-linked SusC/RagA family outer membrane protein
MSLKLTNQNQTIMGTFQNLFFLWRKGLLTLFLLCIAFSLTWAQQKTVTGKVTSKTEGPLVGVYVVIQGTTTGVVTDVNGNYSISVPGPEAVLVFTYVGYNPQTATVGSQSKIDIVMVPSISALGEIVVTGYTAQRKREITSAITRVGEEEFNKGSITAPVQLIQGKVAGLSINKPGGNPNGSYDLRLRGLSTIGSNTQPLIVIDGVIGGSLENVDPNDIESINVLKDASAASIYGSRGASGVIIVTTKQGKRGAAQVEYNGYVTADMVAKTVPVMNAAEWRALSKEVGLGHDYGYTTDWFDETTRTAITQVHNLSLSGGSEKSTYRAAINFHNANGIMITSGYQQINGRINFTQRALDDKLTFDGNLGVTRRQATYGFDDAFRYATIYNPTAPVRSTDAAYSIYDGYFNQVLFDYYNPVQILEENKNDGIDKLLNISLKGTYQLMKGLTVDAFYSLQTTDGIRGTYYDKNSYFVGMNRNGLASRSEDISTNQLFESTVRWTGDVISGANLNVVGGYSYQDFKYEGFYAQGGDFLTDAFSYNNLAAALDFKKGKGTITSYKNSDKLIAFFGLMNFNFKDIWFLTASARYEGSSRFGADNKWGIFPAVGGGVDLSKFLKKNFIDILKVRASYGITGNRPNSSYLSLLRLGPQGNFFYNGEFVPGYAPVSNANPDLKWEKQGEFDAGFDYSFLNSKISGSFDYYVRRTKDLIFQYEVPVPPNLYNQAWLNLGEIKSSGLELSLSVNVIKKSSFTYTVNLTPSYNLSNRLISLSGTYNGAQLEYGTRDLTEMGSPGMTGVPLVRVEEGKPIGQLFTLVFKEIDPNGNLIMVDENDDGTIDPLDRRVTGHGLPDFLVGFGNNFTYKNWDANLFFRAVTGHDLINSYRAFYEVPNEIGSYNLPKTAVDMRNAETGVLLNNSSGVLSSIHVENASFLCLDNMSIGYSFKMAGTYFNRLRIYLAGNNLFYITKYKGVDPSPRYGDIEDNNNPLKPGIDRRNTWFRTRSVSFGANIVF